MATYVYSGRDVLGRLKRGKIEADNKEIARNILLSRGIVAINRLQESRPLFGGAKGAVPILGRIKSKDIVIFTRQLHSMINAGIPLVSALKAIQQQIDNRRLAKVIEDLAGTVEEGGRFSTALSKYRDVFGDLYISMIHAAEESGTLDITLKRLAEYLEKIETLKGKIKSAMFYPVFVLIVATIIVTGILIFLIPTFAQLYADMGGELPALTQFVINVSNFLRDYIGWFFLGIVLFIVVFVQIKKIPKVKLIIDRFVLSLPLFGPLLLKATVANFSRTLSSMISSGINILDALSIAAKTSNNKVIESLIMQVRGQVEKGVSMSLAMAKHRIFPPMLVNMVSIGEEAGNLDEMLGKVADFYEEEVDRTVEGLTSLIEPVMIVFIGSIIGFIIISMYLPIFKIGELIK